MTNQTIAAIATRTGKTRLRIGSASDKPVEPNKFSGAFSTGAPVVCCVPVALAGAALLSSAPVVPAPAVFASSCASTVDSRLTTNCFSNLSLTSASAPRPNCAILPVIVRSVFTVQRVVLVSTTSNCAVIIADALPLPVESRPSPFKTARCAESLRS